MCARQYNRFQLAKTLDKDLAITTRRHGARHLRPFHGARQGWAETEETGKVGKGTKLLPEQLTASGERAEEMVPELIGSLFGKKQESLDKILATAIRINSRNSSIFWESERNADLVFTFLKRRRDVEGDTDKDLAAWIDRFEKDKTEAALDFWYEVHKGTHEVLREF